MNRFACLLLLVLLSLAYAMADEPCSSLEAQRDQLKKQLDKLQQQQLPEDQIADLDNLLGQVEDLLDSNAKDQSDVVEKIEELEKKLPESDAPMVKAINDFVQSVKGGVSGTAKYQKDAADFLSGARAKLNTIKDFYAAGDESTAKAQIDAFGNFFDDMTNVVPGIKQVPGLGKLFDAYSQGIHGIANNAGTIDSVMARNAALDKELDELHRGGFYVHGKTPREQRADAINLLSQRLADVEGRIGDGSCDGGQQDPCTDPHSRVVQSMRTLHKKFDADRDLQSRQDEAECGNAWSAAASAALEMNDTSKTAAQRSAARRRYRVQNAAYFRCAADRKAHTESYEKNYGDWLNQESNAQHWTPDEEKRFDDCFPYSSLLRDKARLAPNHVPSPIKPKPSPPKNPQKNASGKPAPPPKKPNCTSGGGLAGAVEGVTNQMNGCQ